jgi:hypothetical protein
MRSQQYRACAVAMRVALWAAWNYPEYNKQPPCPSLPSADIAAWEREPDPTMKSAKLFIAVLERLRVLASLTCPHPLVGQEDSARQAACLWSELYLHVQAVGNCGSELGRFHRGLTVEAHIRQERDFGENPPPAPTLTGAQSLLYGAARLRFFSCSAPWALYLWGPDWPVFSY